MCHQRADKSLAMDFFLLFKKPTNLAGFVSIMLRNQYFTTERVGCCLLYSLSCFLLLLLLLLVSGHLMFDDDIDGRPVLDRRKRYVLFPEGSSFSVAFCMTIKTTTPDVDIFTEGVNWAISYDLPNETRSREDAPFDPFLPPAPVLLRRHRRSFYSKLEVLFNAAGVDGRACVLRTICEAAQRLIPRGNMVDEMLRILFTMPLEHVHGYEPEEHHQYDAAHRTGLTDSYCPDMFPTCPVSLLDIALDMNS
ncbi:uncharacterized protein [Anabrus simplex]|uniref:uncharacterized protein n=1 Tax=Anabrus simplex TaxID=316456 RepID=UPI0035A2B6EE